MADILQVYKSNFSANVSGELVIPESLKMLPVYVLGMVKSPILRVAIGERVDRRVHMLTTLNYMPYHRSVTFAYPKLYAPSSAVPSKLSVASLAEHGGVALLDTSFEMLLLVSRSADPSVLAHVFAVTSFDQIDPAQPLPLVDSPTSTQVGYKKKKTK
jgi:protein transport protein SEC24